MIDAHHRCSLAQEDGAWPADGLDIRQSSLTGALPSSNPGKRKRAARRSRGKDPRAQQAQAYLALSSENVAAWWVKIAEQEALGKKVYWPRQADTVDLDAIAYAESALEVVQQCRALDIDPSHFYLCALDTTQAGVGLGLSFLQNDMHVRGICPMDDVPQRREEMAPIANSGAKRLGLDLELCGSDFDNDDSFVGERYGIPSPAGLEALRTVARTEGILLDPVYTSKAMAALFQHMRAGALDADRPVVFLHTGGNPALFAYAADVLDS